MQVPGGQDLISRFLREFGEWAWLESSFVGGFVGPGMRVLDGGAYVGSFTLALASRQPALVVAVEANPVVLPLLRHNLGTLAAGWARVEHGLLGDGFSPVAAPHAPQPDNLGATSFRARSATPQARADTPDADPIPVPALSLQALRQRHGPFDLIKLDIEGFEQEALQADADWLRASQPALWLECNEDPAVLPLFEFVASLGYELHYAAFPSFNPGNHLRNPKPVFPVSYEAGLLAVRPGTPVQLPAEHRQAECELVPLADAEQLRRCLWHTPRWGLAQWRDCTRPQLLALCARLHGQQDYTTFLRPPALPPADEDRAGGA
jgi:FkbM family methyltransferase